MSEEETDLKGLLTFTTTLAQNSQAAADGMLRFAASCYCFSQELREMGLRIRKRRADYDGKFLASCNIRRSTNCPNSVLPPKQGSEDADK